MTCSLLRSRTAVTVVVQDWPFRAPILPSRRDSSRAPTRTPPQVPSLSDFSKLRDTFMDNEDRLSLLSI